MQRLRSVLVLSLSLAASACVQQAATGGQCTTLLDCGAGETCVSNLCVSGKEIPQASYGVELLPATNVGSGPVRTELGGLELGKGGVELAFARPAVLSGRVVVTEDGMDAQQSVAATVTVTRRSRIGLSAVVTSAEATAGKANGENAFSLRLAPTSAATDADCENDGADCYELRVMPADIAAFPPVVSRIALPGDRRLDIALTGSWDVVRVTGTVRDATLAGAGGLEVRIVDGDGRTISSVGTTVSEGTSRGAFQLMLSRSFGAKKVWLQVSESKQRQGVPSFLFAFDVPAGDLVQLGDVLLLDFQAPVDVTYRVKGPASSGQLMGVAGALVRFTMFLSAPFALSSPEDCPSDSCAVYTRQATTDENGEVTLSLLPSILGGYSVEIVPGPNSPFSAYAAEGVLVVQPGLGADFVLGRKIEVRGALVDAAGDPVAGATIRMAARAQVRGALTENDPEGVGARGAVRAADLALEEPPAAIVTDDHGEFLLMVEPDVSYDMTIVPSSSSPLPITVIPGRSFSSPSRMNVRLPEATLLTGSIVTWDGAEAAGTLVRVYEVVTDIDTLARTAWLRGEAVASGKGEFRLPFPVGPAEIF